MKTVVLIGFCVACLTACVRADHAIATFKDDFSRNPFDPAHPAWIAAAKWEWVAPAADAPGAITGTSPTNWALCRPIDADLIAVQKGDVAKARATVNNRNGNGWTYISIEWLNASGQIVSTTESEKVGDGTTDLSVQGSAPDGAAYACIGLRVGGNKGVAMFTSPTLTVQPASAFLGELDKSGLVYPDLSAIADDDYVRVVDGHFSVRGERLRLWGSQTSPMGANHIEIDNEVAQFRELGFNLFRTISVNVSMDFDYTRGDNSRSDLMDYNLAAIARSGGYNWLDIINSVRFSEKDVDIVDDPLVSRADWLEAMKGKVMPTSAPQLIWDKRTQEIYFRYLDAMMEHVNPYTGLRYADDPSIAVMELVNESWWTPTMLGGSAFTDLSPAIVKPLLLQWNHWLKERYQTTRKLCAAWGELLPDESLEKSNVLLQPLQGAAAMDRMASVLGINIIIDQDAKKAIPGNAQRGRDVVLFFIDAHRAFKHKAIERLRSHGKPGRGAAVVPVVIDTGASYSPQSAYEQTVGSGYAFAMYYQMTNTAADNPRFPWLVPLLMPPDMGNWMVQNKIEGFPGLIYENMIFEPAKYRADYPLRLAAFAAIQDLDVIDWHFYGDHKYGKNAVPINMPNAGHYWNAVVFGNDEVLMAMQLLAGNIFVHGELKQPEKPTVLVVGQDVLYGTGGNWGTLGKALSATAMQHGLRLRFDPNAKQSHFIGPHGETYTDVVRPTPEITYRWKQGIMTIESPRVLVLAGFVPANFTFAGGEKLSGLSVRTPPGSAFATDDERYVCFAMTSRDGLPLAGSNDIIVSAVSTSINTGFKFDPKKFDQEYAKLNGHGPLASAASLEPGTLPVLVSRVGWTFTAPWLKGMEAVKKDFSLQSFDKRSIPGDSITVTADEPLFYMQL